VANYRLESFSEQISHKRKYKQCFKVFPLLENIEIIIDKVI